MENTVRARVVRIGNSRGVRIPKVWLKQLALGEEVEMAVRKDTLVLRRPKQRRLGWADAFRAMAENKDDRLLDPVRPTKWESEEWEW